MLRSPAPFVMEISALNRDAQATRVGGPELLQRRLRNQRLVDSRFRRPADVVSWLGAVQSQDFPAAKWGISLRANDVREVDIDKAFDAGEILRTHILRPTWHFVHRDDVRWMLALSGPRVERALRHYYKVQELDAKLFLRSRAVFERALEGGRSLTRPELGAALNRARISASGIRLAFIVMQAELAAVICSGPRRDKQFTYMLLDERAGRTSTMARDEALARLTRRYFTSHGPATIRDFVWWSGLTVADARAGLAMNSSTLVQDHVDGVACWHDGERLGKLVTSPFVRLLANYDEYFIAFRDRAWFTVPRPPTASPRDRSIFAHQLVIDGYLCGAWSRTLRAQSVDVSVRPFRVLRSAERHAVAAEAERYGRFLQLAASVRIDPLKPQKTPTATL
jgi:hypothetical protein